MIKTNEDTCPNLEYSFLYGDLPLSKGVKLLVKKKEKEKMDRDWMYKASHTSEIYAAGVQSFLSAAEANRVKKKEVGQFVVLVLYECWSRHGESLAAFSTSSTANDTTYNDDASNLNSTYNNDSSNLDENDNHLNGPDENLNEMLHDMETNMGDAEIENLQHLFEDAEKPLYTGSRLNKLDAVLNLSNLKSKNRWSDKSFTELLVFLHDRMLLEDNELPISTYRAKKLMCPMGLEVERIHACPNNCILYRKRYENEHKCVVCGASRYKQKKDLDEVDDDEVKKKRSPAKMLWYLPIIPRLKRLFSNEKEAKLLCWHSDERVIDGKLRHVADSPQWRTIDNKYPEFGKETRNIRFGLSSDGFNPFGGMSSIYSTWPVLLCIYNLPPWLCMKRKYIMMSLLIQGPKQPSNNIDVYLSPLIDDLKTLWDSGVNLYDAYEKEHFQLHARIFCTINDFPAYGNLSGYTTKGKKACPVCENETSATRLTNCRKHVYMGHRRFLQKGHIFRNKTVKFDGNIETGTMKTRSNAFLRVKKLNTVLGKRSRVEKGTIWKKKVNLLGFTLLERFKGWTLFRCYAYRKNVCDSLIGLLLNIKGKTKDGIKVRKDMKLLNIRKELHPEKRGDRIYLPHACYNTTKEERRQFCQCLHDIKVIDVEQLDKWQKDIYVTLCELEMYFPPSFFDIMVHLISHIVQEIKACGPVFLRHMYPFERYMSVLKGYVRNRHQPEGSIIEGYTSEEVIKFCQGYVEGLDSVGIVTPDDLMVMLELVSKHSRHLTKIYMMHI
ncbi:uncharacterized protein LOC143553586 [Bidens hawaiensis]|uniref:uncharacterized protein LOC143553586 n=1 Tax=Bidens hawaiensis TaxID=980011 RepID=UPI00404B37CE